MGLCQNAMIFSPLSFLNKNFQFGSVWFHLNRFYELNEAYVCLHPKALFTLYRNYGVSVYN